MVNILIISYLEFYTWIFLNWFGLTSIGSRFGNRSILSKIAVIFLAVLVIKVLIFNSLKVE